MTTIGEALHHLLRGDVMGGAEVLMQRFKSLETFAHQGTWDHARHLELVHSGKVSCVSVREEELAVTTEMMEQRLQRGRAHGSSGRSPSPRSPR